MQQIQAYDLPQLTPDSNNKGAEGRIHGLIDLVLLTVSCYSLISMMVLLRWALHRGFDTTDEGFYLLASASAADYPYAVSFHYLLQPLPYFTQSRVLDFRFAQLIVQLLGAALLGAGYLGWLWKEQIVRSKLTLAVCFITCLIGNLLLFCKFPFSISYNSLSGFFLFAATGLLLISPLIESNPKFSPRYAHLIVFVAGICTGLSLFAKFPTFFTYLPIGALLLWLSGSQHRRRNIALFALGISAALTFYFTQFQSPGGWLQPILDWLAYQRQWHTKHADILHNYWCSMQDLLLHFQPALAIALAVSFSSFLLVGMATRKLNSRKRKMISASSHLLLWAGIAAWLLHEGGLQHNFYTASVFSIIGLALAAQFAGAATANRQFAKWRELLRLSMPSIAVALLPFACAGGTANPLHYQVTIFLSATFLWVLGLACVLTKQTETRAPLVTTVALLCLLSVSQFKDGLLNRPYGLFGQTLKDQTEKTALANLRGLTIHPELERFLSQLDHCLQLNGFKRGDTIIALYSMPGVVYALGGKSAGLPWYFQLPIYFHYQNRYLRKLAIPSSGRLFLLQGAVLDSEAADALSHGSLGFPQNFRLVGRFRGPFDLNRPELQPYKPYFYQTVSVYVLDQAKTSLRATPIESSH